MTTVKATFDGHAFVPESDVDLPLGYTLDIPIPSVSPNAVPTKKSCDPSDDKPLSRLMETLDQLPANPTLPEDFAAQHDHYLYGTPKQNDSD